MKRPDLSQTTSEIRAYIEALEAELAGRHEPAVPAIPDAAGPRAEPAVEPSESATPLNVIVASQRGRIKRTPRHLYTRQHRGGMGIFDLEVAEDDPPAFLTVAERGRAVLLITTQARAFRLPVADVSEAPVRSRGQRLSDLVPLGDDERLAAILPLQDNGYVHVVSERGEVRRFRYHFFKEGMTPGTVLYDLKELGQPAAACWSSGEADILIATRQGRALRFAENSIPLRGCLGIRLAEGDRVAAVAAVSEASSVFMLGADGKGIIRQMSGFSANKAAGSGGKSALKTDQLVGALTVDEGDDLFIISRLSKIIRFPAGEVSTTEGVVQGVNCMTLRADEARVVAATGSNN